MSKIDESISIGVANEGQINVPRENIERWEPKKISIIGSTVFFKQDEQFLSMDRTTFQDIFGSKFYKFK